MTIRDSLDAAALDSCGGVSFGDTELYDGYYFSWWNGTSYETDECSMRVYGDGNHIMPS
jgi:hypothetical protein